MPVSSIASTIAHSSYIGKRHRCVSSFHSARSASVIVVSRLQPSLSRSLRSHHGQ
ncbi:hypothetical protein I6G56_06050 [Burkholderia humptydooensis]|uniref:Uncharacterized protein n=1 Tax=Burkholderia humptydooensis TaxID=430531 RepID=A0A7T2U2T0_9BURK|nr:hypothetical protein I6G56_06050 [Burkholderia humptydooensis]